MGTSMQNFDLYDLGGKTAADMHDGPIDAAATVRRVVEHHNTLDLDNEDDRETLINALTNALRQPL
jgi:hypothetical protein